MSAIRALLPAGRAGRRAANRYWFGWRVGEQDGRFVLGSTPIPSKACSAPRTEHALRSVYRSPAEALDALASGEVDAAITDNASAQTYLAAHPDTLNVLSPPLTDEPFVVAVPARADALAPSVNATIERLRNSGELARIMGQPSK